MNKKELVYLASPYTAPTPEAMEGRFLAALEATAALMGRGLVVFSPIAHTHPIAVHHELPRDWTYWRQYDETILSKCDRVIVLTLPGWRDSRGIAAEVGIAKECGIPIEFCAPSANYVLTATPED